MLDLATIRTDPSPNFDYRRGDLLDLVVVHYTAGGSAGSSVRWLCNPAARASAHYVIGREGAIIELVPPERRAWHVGASSLIIDGELRRGLNDSSIGIELANHGLLDRDGDAFVWQCGRRLYPYRRDAEPVEATLELANGNEVVGFWEPYPEAQLDTLARLVDAINRRYPATSGRLVGHEEIGRPVGRKIDPGPLFPWERFERRLPRLTSGRLET